MQNAALSLGNFWSRGKLCEEYKSRHNLNPTFSQMKVIILAWKLFLYGIKASRVDCEAMFICLKSPPDKEQILPETFA